MCVYSADQWNKCVYTFFAKPVKVFAIIWSIWYTIVICYGDIVCKFEVSVTIGSRDIKESLSQIRHIFEKLFKPKLFI